MANDSYNDAADVLITQSINTTIPITCLQKCLGDSQHNFNFDDSCPENVEKQKKYSNILRPRLSSPIQK